MRFKAGRQPWLVATAVLRRRGNTDVENLFWARQTLYGKELLIEIAAAE